MSRSQLEEYRARQRSIRGGGQAPSSLAQQTEGVDVRISHPDPLATGDRLNSVSAAAVQQ